MDEDCHDLIPTDHLPPEIASPNHLQNILYFSDLHIDYKIRNAGIPTDTDSIRAFIFTILKEVWKNTLAKIPAKSLHQSIIIIPGDVSFDFQNVKIFFEELKQITKDIPIIYTLGNHELWFQTNGEFNPYSFSVDEIVDYYRKLCLELDIILLHNDILCIEGKDYSKIIPEETTNSMDENYFSKIINNSDYLILGGTGFSAFNPIYNQSYNLYQNTIHSLEEETAQSNRFLKLFNKVEQAYFGLNPPIIITHNPPADWLPGSIHSEMIVFHGHTHKNIKIIDDDLKIIANCQWGHNDYLPSMGIYDFSDKQDIFGSFGDGIYQISPEQYRQFNDKFQIIFGGTQKKTIFMLKKNGYYAFFTKSANNNLQILNGGRPYNVDKTDLGYYYNNLDKMIKSIKYRIKRLSKHLESISSAIKKIGGTGHSHGLIVDIDGYNHIILDPKTNQIIPYYAEFIDRKIPYRDLRQLLSDRRTDLLKKYDLLNKSNDLELCALCNQTFSIVRSDQFSTDTSMYDFSNKIFRLQYLLSHKILREWDEFYISDYNHYNNYMPTIHSNPTIIPKIIDLSITDYYNSPFSIDDNIKSDIKSAVQSYYGTFMKRGPFGSYPKLSVNSIVTECQKMGVPYLTYDLNALIEEELSKCVNADFPTRTEFNKFVSDHINPFSIKETELEGLSDFVSNLLKYSKINLELNTIEKRNYKKQLISNYFLRFLFSPDQIDSFLSEKCKHHQNEQKCHQCCAERICLFIKWSQCHNNRELDNLNLYICQRIDVLFGHRPDVNQDLREYLQDKVVLDRRDNTLKLNRLYRSFTIE